MPEIDDETVARVLQWCAEAGRRTSPAEVHSALSGLSWDALLAVRAVLADDPPARPLGPFALAEIARGVAPELAAQREREGAYAPAGASTVEAATPPDAEPPPRAPEKKTTRGRATRKVATVVIRRARDRHEEPAPAAPPPPLLDELFASEGRAVLQRWIRQHGARRAPLVAELSRWRLPDGSPPREDDLDRLLDAHGLARPFERREREEVLHAVRAAGGRLGRAAAALGTTPDALASSARRLGITRDVEAVRDERREDIRRRATLGDRVRLLVDEGDRLDDLGMTAEIEADLRSRLAEHLNALRAAHARHLDSSFARTLGVTREQATQIAARFGLDLRDAQPRPERPASGYDRASRTAAAPSRRPPPATSHARPGEPRAPSRAGAPRPHGRPAASRPGATRSYGSPAPSRPGATRSHGSAAPSRPGAPRPDGSRPAPSRRGAPRPQDRAGAARSPAAENARPQPRSGPATPRKRFAATPRRDAPRPRKPPRR